MRPSRMATLGASTLGRPVTGTKSQFVQEEGIWSIRLGSPSREEFRRS
jgi:hypothetical protein